MRFEWDAAKDKENQAKHGLSLREATVLFESGVDYLEIFDEEHSEQEDRFIAIGRIKQGVIVVAFTERDDDVVRLISARPATKSENNHFEEHERKKHER